MSDDALLALLVNLPLQALQRLALRLDAGEASEGDRRRANAMVDASVMCGLVPSDELLAVRGSDRRASMSLQEPNVCEHGDHPAPEGLDRVPFVPPRPDMVIIDDPFHPERKLSPEGEAAMERWFIAARRLKNGLNATLDLDAKRLLEGPPRPFPHGPYRQGQLVRGNASAVLLLYVLLYVLLASAVWVLER